MKKDTLPNITEIYKWINEYFLLSSDYLTYGIHDFKDIISIENDKIIFNCSVALKNHITEIKYPLGVVNGDFSCFDCKLLTSLKNSPDIVVHNFTMINCEKISSLKHISNYIGDSFEISYCDGLTSLKDFPKDIKNYIYFQSELYSNNKTHKQRYSNYIVLWDDFLENITIDEKIEYINIYTNRVDSKYGEPIIPNEIINKYKIDYLLRNQFT